MGKIKLLLTFIVFLVAQNAGVMGSDVPKDMTPENTAILVIDIQPDFLKGGSLAVAGAGKKYVKKLERVLKRAQKNKYDNLIATQDWHPVGHFSFSSTHITEDPKAKPFTEIESNIKGKKQMLWPDHCVQDTPGAAVELDNKLFKKIVQKGQDPKYDSYSGFKNDNGASTGLAEYLNELKIKYVFVLGLATDYCVQSTAVHAEEAGFKTYLVEDLSHGVKVVSTKKVLLKLRSEGKVKVIQSEDAVFKHILGTQGKKKGKAAHGKHKAKIAGKSRAHAEGKSSADGPAA